MRDGFSELPPVDQHRMQRRAIEFVGVKKGAEFAGLRPTRYTLHTDLSAGAKRLYLVRHGEGFHNAWRATEIAAGRVPTAKRHNAGDYPAELHDPCLTEKGHADAAAAATAAKDLPQPELLVTSPLRRAVQTMLVAFRGAISARVPSIAHELCREAFHGTDPSVYDSRLSRNELATAFPQVDFLSHVLPEEASEGAGSHAVTDPIWWHCASPLGRRGEHGIDEAAIAAHSYQFLEWVMARPESVIAVVTHSNFLLALYHACLDSTPADPQVFFTGATSPHWLTLSPTLTPHTPTSADLCRSWPLSRSPSLIDLGQVNCAPWLFPPPLAQQPSESSPCLGLRDREQWQKFNMISFQSNRAHTECGMNPINSLTSMKNRQSYGFRRL